MGLCCFITQEHQSIPSGVVTIIIEILSHWPPNDSQRLMVLCNQDHWAFEHFMDLQKKGKIRYLKRCPFLTVMDIRNRIIQRVKNPILSKYLLGIIILLRPIYTVLEILQLRRFFRRCNVSAIFSHNGGYPGGDLNRISVIAGYLAGIRKNYMFIHNVPVPVFRFIWWINKLRDRLIAYSTTQLFSVSQACAQSLEKKRYFDSVFQVIPNGIDVEPPPPIVQSEFPPDWKSDTPTIIFLGELHPRKGLDVLFDALGYLECSFIMVLYGNGTEEYTNHLKEKAKQFGYFDQVYFEGFQDCAARMIRYCDLTVLPSVAYESFGLVLLEAMYWKKPVICSDFGGMKEVVQHEHTGLVVPAGDALALKDAIQYILDNPHIGEKWGINGYNRLKKHFDIRLISEKYYRLSRSPYPDNSSHNSNI